MLDPEREFEEERWPGDLLRRLPSADYAGRRLTGASESESAGAATTSEAPPPALGEDSATTEEDGTSADSPPGDYAPSKTYGCVSACRATECPDDADTDLCDGDEISVRRLHWARGRETRRSRRLGLRARGRRLNDVGEAGAMVIATSTIEALEA
ncbi:unnamed protein product, partial [Prorocentrum cordatum]